VVSPASRSANRVCPPGSVIGSSNLRDHEAISDRPTGSKSPRPPPHFLADNLSDLNAAQGLYAVSYQMQELLPLYLFNLMTFHIDENESRHFVGDFKLRFEILIELFCLRVLS